MSRLEQIKTWVRQYNLGYLFNPGGTQFTSSIVGVPDCQVSDYVADEGEYQDDESFNKLRDWIQKYHENQVSN